MARHGTSMVKHGTAWRLQSSVLFASLFVAVFPSTCFLNKANQPLGWVVKQLQLCIGFGVFITLHRLVWPLLPSCPFPPFRFPAAPFARAKRIFASFEVEKKLVAGEKLEIVKRRGPKPARSR